jgi:tRNA uridine 5-carboxymethylaminomethyl modification enzyme
MNAPYDILVVGAGHAGIEAAAAAARLGCRVGVLSGNLDTVGKMSCNPAIGGLAKGQLVREIDCLGGVMARATDACGIHFRVLAGGKGPAMWSPRAQCDKSAYAAWMKHWLEQQPGIFPIQGEAVAIRVNREREVRGLALRDGRELQAPRVVLTTGTFLRGLLHQGEAQTPGGRMGDHAALGLSGSLQELGLKLARLKTGTPMRLHRASIDLGLCEEQPGDPAPQPFAFRNARPVANRVVCWICHTTPEAHAAITANLHRAPMYNGQIASVGPKYCPSIEDKVVRFADRERHQLFLEPEGLGTQEVYVNGLSTSLPTEVQDQILHAIPALRRAHVMRYGYAVEYDAVQSDQIDHALSVPSVPGLFLAGQINGTSGYEEAAMQGLLAGANAALSLAGRDRFVLDRAEAYGGVLVDDLVTRVPDEPYRMFTSRAEHRLHLRADNADRRLAARAAAAGLVDAAWAEAVAAKAARIAAACAAVPDLVKRQIAGEGWELAQALQQSPALAALAAHALQEAESAWIDLRYAAFLERHRGQLERIERQRHLRLPDGADYAGLSALSKEARRVLAERRPATLGDAGLLPGVDPADIEVLWAWLQRGSRERAAS